MKEEDPQGRALRPLWSMFGGAVVAATATLWVVEPGPIWARTALMLLGASALLAALFAVSRNGGNPNTFLWFAAGLALVGGRGLGTAADRMIWEHLAANPDSIIRARIVINEGWTDSRWGQRSRISVLDAEDKDLARYLPRRIRIEVRGADQKSDLPGPGTVAAILGHPAGAFGRAILVVPSARLIQPSNQLRLLPHVRDRMAKTLIAAAETDVTRIRSAELAAALALGRRDLVPEGRRDRWRRSGFAHLLAVSGLHVGIVGGTVWLLAALLGAGPRMARLIALVLIPAYAVLAGGSPSAVRAALMGVIYLGARFLGRAVLPMAAVLLAALVLLVVDPQMVAEPGFQLTVVITAALIRWVPPVTAALRGPLWLTGAVALPLVAQVAAAPLVAWHFRSLIPGAVVANVLALPLLAPAVMFSVLAAILAPIWAGGSALVLTVLHYLMALLGAFGGPARVVELIAPRIPSAAVIVLAAFGWLALQTARPARWAAAAWVGLLVLLNLRLASGAAEVTPQVTVLPVVDGAAVVVAAGHDVVLADAGRYRRQTAVLLTDAGHRRLHVLIASHTDEDHIGGAVEVLRTLDVNDLVVPNWMVAAVESVPLLRTARSAGTRVVPVARGSTLSTQRLRLEVLWPPAHNPPLRENERSIVVRIDLGTGSAVLTSDIGRTTERRISRSARLNCDVLVIPHHGSRGGSSAQLLEATTPSIALVPAAPGNTHGHPHREVLERLADRGITVRIPRRDTAVGAMWIGEQWRAYP